MLSHTEHVSKCRDTGYFVATHAADGGNFTGISVGNSLARANSTIHEHPKHARPCEHATTSYVYLARGQYIACSGISIPQASGLRFQSSVTQSMEGVLQRLRGLAEFSKLLQISIILRLASFTLLFSTSLLFLLVGLSSTIIKSITIIDVSALNSVDPILNAITKLRFGVWGVCTTR